MYLLPCHAQFGDSIQQPHLNLAELPVGKTEICPQFRWAGGTIQVENGTVSLPDDVNVCRPMIVGVDYDAQTPQSQHRWHEGSVP
jgi:hypothetical protein